MHISPSDFRAVRRDNVLLHYAILNGIAFALADLPESGTAGTFVEEWCEAAHWAFAVSGGVELDLGDDRKAIPAGTAFHVPSGMRHRVLAPGRTRVAGFTRVGPDTPTADETLRTAGFEVVRSRTASPALAAVAIQPSRPERPPAAGEIVAASRRMGDLIFTRTRFGPTSGYTSSMCDVPHWGLVTSGSLAIEFEDGVEVVTSGDVFYCPPGPPGHRLHAADPAITVDFTPIDVYRRTERVGEWRRASLDAALAERDAGGRLELAALV